MNLSRWNHRFLNSFSLLGPVGILSFLFTSAWVSAADKPYISVGTAKTKKTILAYPSIQMKGGASDSVAKTIKDTVTNDLMFMDLFKFLDSKAFIEPSGAGLTPNLFKMSDWTAIKAEFLMKTALSSDGAALTLETYLYDTYGGKAVLAKRYLGSPSDAKAMAHTFANDVVQALTGSPGIFQTKIAMSCDRGGKKEIYVMNFDGSEVKQITQHQSIAFAPAWSPDSTRLVYSLYTKRKNNVKNIDLYQFDFRDSTIRMLSNRSGMNSGAVFHPDGKHIALTMSFLGSEYEKNPEIFLFNPDDNSVTRLTKSLGFDVDPSFNPDGKQITFVSSRSGMPMVFRMNTDGSSTQRLTYAGRYNATPSWSPTNNKIAFAGHIDRVFDVFIMNPDGSNIERLTKSQSNNEDPYFSPDGNFITFSSNRTGQKNIYVMNLDGSYVKRLTFGLGNCTAPKWSRPPVK